MTRMVLRCLDFGIKSPCCPECTEDTKTTVYPKNFDNRPDLGMGIRGLMCCHHIHVAQKLPRLWWYEKYLRDSNRFLESEIRYALSAVKENCYRIDGEIHAAARAREEQRATRKTTTRAVRTVSKGCPECGSNWNEIACNNCGYVG